MGLEQVAQVPVLLMEGGRWLVLVGFGRFFQSQAEAVGGVGRRGDGLEPFPNLPVQLLELGSGGVDYAVRRCQGI